MGKGVMRMFERFRKSLQIEREFYNEIRSKRTKIDTISTVVSSVASSLTSLLVLKLLNVF